jgi:hypothetical protein
MAVRDEIVEMVLKKEKKPGIEPKTLEAEPLPIPGSSDLYKMTSNVKDDQTDLDPPKTGVEVVSVTKRGGQNYFTVRDLRNGNVVKNVTLKSSRRLWHYAISQYSKLPKNIESQEITWKGDLGLISRKKRGNYHSYDMIQRTKEGFRHYYGVTDDGIHGEWEALI